MTDLMQPILDQLSKLRGRVDHMPTVRWGTVTSASPLLVLLDGSLDASPLSPQTTVAGLTVGDRVACVEQHRRVIVIGRGGGLAGGTRVVAFATSSLANNATWQGSVPLGKVFALFGLTLSDRARVRVYASAAHRAGDLSRPVGVVPSGDHGLLFEEDGESGPLSYVLPLTAYGANFDAGGDVAVAVTNRSGSMRAIEGIFTCQ